MLLLQDLQAARQWVCDLQILILGFVFAMCLVNIERSFHLLDGIDNSLGLVGHVVLFGLDESHLVMQSFGECREQLMAISRMKTLALILGPTSDSRVSRSWLGTPISSKRPWSCPMIVDTCEDR